MTREEILSLPAGPALDAMVAEKVMGWRRHKRNTAFWVPAKDESAIVDRPSAIVGEWRPSRDIAAAWEVVARLLDKYDLWVALENSGCAAPLWAVKVFGQDWRVEADDAPLAICLAALLAVEGV